MRVRIAPLLLASLVLPYVAEAPAQEAAATNANPLSDLTLESLEATLAVPLFTPSRTPPFVEPPPEPEPVVVAPPPEPVEPPPVPPPFRLIGILMSEAEEVALLSDPNTGEVHSFASGDSHDGWVIDIVDTRTVTFQNGDQTHTLAMFEEFEAPGIPGYSEEWNFGVPTDPNTGLPIDPNTGLPVDPSMLAPSPAQIDEDL